MPSHTVSADVDVAAPREPSSSYRPGRGRQRDAEMERLDRQADLTFGAEFDLMLRGGLRTDGTLLDLGSGNGTITRRLRDRLPRAQVIGADVDPQLLALVPEPALLLVDGRIPLEENAVDDVLVRFVAQHLPPSDRASLWAEVLRVLRPGGRVHVVDVDDSDAGVATPEQPGLRQVYAKVFHAQAALGGDRAVIGKVAQELSAAGFSGAARCRESVTSQQRPLEDFAVHIGPERHVASVAEGVLSIADLAAVTGAWQAILTDPQGYISINVHMVRASKPVQPGHVPSSEGETS